MEPQNLVLFHSELKKEKHGYTMDEARTLLQGIDDDAGPVRVVISVLALREGFDKTNICVICALRASEADILLEQIVGRGLRLMFPNYKVDSTIWSAKQQAVEALKRREKPLCTLDFLYIVEHPRFETFYEALRKAGYLIGEGDSSDQDSTGDLLAVEAEVHRVQKYDIAWPSAVHEAGKLPDLSVIDVTQLPTFSLSIDQVRLAMEKLAITDVYMPNSAKAGTWTLQNPHFNYDEFLRLCAQIIVRDGKTPVLTAKWAQIMALVDEYTSQRLFKTEIDFQDEFNYKVLAYKPLQDHVTKTLRNVICDLIGNPQFELRGQWRRLSDLPRILVRNEHSVPTAHCIYPRMGYSRSYGGLERDVMTDVLDSSADVLAWCKLQRRHGLAIAYRDPSGILRTYEVDFIIRTADRIYILETKSDRDMELQSVGLKARAAKHWCQSISGAAGGPAGQPTDWEYLLLPQNVFEANRLASFTALIALMRQARDGVVAAEQGALFA